MGCFLGFLLTSTIFVYVKLYHNPKNNQEFSPDESQFYNIEEKQITSFGTYAPIHFNLPDSGPEIFYNQDLSDVTGMGTITDDRIKQMLSLQGFAVVESDYDQFYEIYRGNKRLDYKHFITVDTLLHTFHILYDYSLRFIEANTLFETLADLSQDLLDWNLNNYNQFSSSNLKDASGRLVAFFAVGLGLLGREISVPTEIQVLVINEIEKINRHSEIVVSEIIGNEVDFTQFIVRGHYTRSEILSNFFLAMMYYSQISFLLQPDSTSGNDRGIDQTRIAALLTFGIFSDEKGKFLNNWKLIYEPTTFFVGKADDLTPIDYINLIDGYSLNDFEQASTIKAIIELGKKLPFPYILGSYSVDEHWDITTKGLRFMGRRFVPDSYFLQNLVNPVIENRTMPSGLDIMGVLNSTNALNHQQKEAETYPAYLNKILELRAEVEVWNSTTWTQNLYFLWLYSLLPLLNLKGEQYPTYMRSTAWADKELNTALGSWAELRHDTILYTKPSFTVPPPSAPAPPPPKFTGAVEANPEVFGRLLSLTRLLQDGLEKRNLIDDSVIRSKLRIFEDILRSLITMVEKELRGDSLSEDEHDKIIDLKDQLKSLVQFPSDIPDEPNYHNSETDDSVALIADIHNDPSQSMILEVGIGKVYELFVIVNDDHGNAYLARGGVFSYYEFSQPMTQRLTDETWQAMLESDTAPLTPTWTQSFLISKED